MTTTKPFATRIAGLVQQRFGVMGADVLRMNIFAKFELCASYEVLC